MKAILTTFFLLQHQKKSSKTAQKIGMRAQIFDIQDDQYGLPLF